MPDILTRQSSLDLNTDQRVVVLGAGGIGAWVVYLLARAGVREIEVWDFDEIEASNLNRTPFQLEHIGLPKTVALTMMLSGLTSNIITKERYQNEPLAADYVIDARDVIDTVNTEAPVVKVGYDGFSCSIDPVPNPREVWGEQAGYEVTPSYIVPPVLVASIVVNAALIGHTGGKLTTFDIRGLTQTLFGSEPWIDC